MVHNILQEKDDFQRTDTIPLEVIEGEKREYDKLNTGCSLP